MNKLNTAKPRLTVVQGTVNYSAMSDAELVMLCKSKDEKAFECLVRRHQRTVYGLLLRLAPDWNDTADLAQEVFIRVWRGLDNLKNPHAFKSWLGQVATHLFYDELRKRPRRTPIISLDQSMFGAEQGRHPHQCHALLLDRAGDSGGESRRVSGEPVRRPRR